MSLAAGATRKLALHLERQRRAAAHERVEAVEPEWSEILKREQPLELQRHEGAVRDRARTRSEPARRAPRKCGMTTIVPPTSTVASIATQLMLENSPSEHSVTQSLR